jgi:hypothetical protein
VRNVDKKLIFIFVSNLKPRPLSLLPVSLLPRGLALSSPTAVSATGCSSEKL